jgi:DNA-binding transcriptional ArsR family regulator
MTRTNAGLESTFAALADPARMGVVRLLSKERRRAGELANALEITPAAMSRHLRALRKSGLVSEEGIAEDARVRIYQLRREPFEQMRGWLEEVEQFWGGQLASFKKHVEQRRRRRGAKR